MQEHDGSYRQTYFSRLTIALSRVPNNYLEHTFYKKLKCLIINNFFADKFNRIVIVFFLSDS